MKTVALLTAVLLCFSIRPSFAAYLTGNDLLHACESRRAASVKSCMSYVAGVIDYQFMLQSLGTEPPTDFCLPRHFPLDKATVVVAVYLQKHPSLQPIIAAAAVTMALAEAYPCAGSAPRKKYRHHGR